MDLYTINIKGPGGEELSMRVPEEAAGDEMLNNLATIMLWMTYMPSTVEQAMAGYLEARGWRVSSGSEEDGE